MAILKIRQYPDAVLSRKSEPLIRIRQKDLALVQDMIDTMYHEDGIGLAAPQVGVSKRIIVVSPNAKRGEERAYINPEMVELSPEEETEIEGCLSLPGIACQVRRAKRIKFKAMDLKGEEKIEEAWDFPARVVQHEVDHHNGILLIDRLDFNQRQVVLGSYRRL